MAVWRVGAGAVPKKAQPQGRWTARQGQFLAFIHQYTKIRTPDLAQMMVQPLAGARQALR